MEHFLKLLPTYCSKADRQRLLLDSCINKHKDSANSVRLNGIHLATRKINVDRNGDRKTDVLYLSAQRNASCDPINKALWAVFIV